MKKQLIKSFEEACKKQGLDPKVLPVVTGLPEKYQQRLIKRYKQMVVTDALNDGWEPDWTDGKWKYYPWMKYTPGVGWSYYFYVFSVSLSHVGSRLVFPTSELARYAGETFPELFADEPEG